MIIIVTTIIFLVILIGLVLYYQKGLWKELLVAFTISLTWVAYYGYNYEGTQLFLFGGINVFALIAWTLGLVIFSRIYYYFKNEYGLRSGIIMSGVIYLALLNIFEWIGYNVLKIQLTSSYHGLLGFNLIHGSIILKIYYLTAWIIFIGLIELVNGGR